MYVTYVHYIHLCSTHVHCSLLHRCMLHITVSQFYYTDISQMYLTHIHCNVHTLTTPARTRQVHTVLSLTCISRSLPHLYLCHIIIHICHIIIHICHIIIHICHIIIHTVLSCTCISRSLPHLYLDTVLSCTCIS